MLIDFTDNYYLSRRRWENREKRMPAVSLRYFCDGKLALSAINEVDPKRFLADGSSAACVIGDSSFRVDTASYGSGFVVAVDLLAARKHHIVAELEWLSVEANIAEEVNGSPQWKMRAPRSDVSGRISLVGRQAARGKLIQFRGTGYTDETEVTDGPRVWGRAHYVDATVVFRIDDRGETAEVVPTLYLVRDAVLREHAATIDIQHTRRDRYGLRIPARFQFKTRDNVRLRVKPVSMIESGFFEARMLSEITLMLRDGKPRKTIGITEFFDPTRVSNPFFRWISDLRIGKNGKPPLL